jgi:hypothetical protein
VVAVVEVGAVAIPATKEVKTVECIGEPIVVALIIVTAAAIQKDPFQITITP